MRDIANRVREITDLWRAGAFSELEKYFHPDVVLAHPRFEQRTVGRDKLIASYADFASQARIHELTLGEVRVDLVGASAIAVTPWRMKYELESGTYDESGWDILVFNEHEGAWVVVWRTVVLDSR
jgi:ketosteroid isomerase-like protein